MHQCNDQDDGDRRKQKQEARDRANELVVPIPKRQSRRHWMYSLYK